MPVYRLWIFFPYYIKWYKNVTASAVEQPTLLNESHGYFRSYETPRPFRTQLIRIAIDKFSLLSMNRHEKKSLPPLWDFRVFFLWEPEEQIAESMLLWLLLLMMWIMMSKRDQNVYFPFAQVSIGKDRLHLFSPQKRRVK